MHLLFPEHQFFTLHQRYYMNIFYIEYVKCEKLIDFKRLSTDWTLIVAQCLGNILYHHFLSHFITGTALKPEPLGPSNSKLLFIFTYLKGGVIYHHQLCVRTEKNAEIFLLCCSIWSHRRWLDYKRRQTVFFQPRKDFYGESQNIL